MKLPNDLSQSRTMTLAKKEVSFASLAASNIQTIGLNPATLTIPLLTTS